MKHINVCFFVLEPWQHPQHCMTKPDCTPTEQVHCLLTRPFLECYKEKTVTQAEPLDLCKGRSNHPTCHLFSCITWHEFFFSQSNLWASASEPAGSMPFTQSPERCGDYHTMASSQGMLREGWKRVKEGGFDWWMVWKWVSWGGHQRLSMSAHAPIPCAWGTVSCVSKPLYAFSQSNIMMTPSVLAPIRRLTNTLLFLMSLLAMKARCEGEHGVVIESLNHHATMWECML